jgi:hypothetical protein
MIAQIITAFLVCWVLINWTSIITMKFFPSLIDYLCPKCLTFWMTFIYLAPKGIENAFVIAAAASFIAYIFEIIIEKLDL